MITIAIQTEMALKLQTFPNSKDYLNPSFCKDKNRSKKKDFMVNSVLEVDSGWGITMKASWPVCSSICVSLLQKH